MQKGSVNKVILVGHLGADPESRFTTAGSAVANFSLATGESWKNSDGENEERTEWHRVVLFGKLAEIANEYLKKGQLAYIEGRIRTRTWDDKDGVTRYTTEVIGDRMTMLGKKTGGSGGGKNSPPPIEGEDGDDLPF